MSFDMFSLMQRRAQGRRAGAGGARGSGSGFGAPGGFSNFLSAGNGLGGLDPKAFTAFPMAPSSFSPNSAPDVPQQASESPPPSSSESSQEPTASPLSGGPAGNLASLTGLAGIDTGIFDSFLGSKNGQ
ncbi:uncharacterized protein BT62DRAFT_1002406 [Guyanagaster necrorhizus]|uniref:Uncharacterized protein n=1 Tax=Guyanagaster necrorhizus TaxID=856835 RepID=A0A9P7W2B9_9AGAR|nr:uncharacterized protein BT62DRAFT_1002406 [Guyanagaster necrorhizus MCA 3950]KAG7450071.1 hypothetical protein BT62DRAFT_1002406 [Guyanagaster necrorhizus MCA 3950]